MLEAADCQHHAYHVYAREVITSFSSERDLRNIGTNGLQRKIRDLQVQAHKS